MSKQKIIFIAVVILLVITSGLYFGLQKKRQIVISNQKLVTSNQEAVVNSQDATNNNQETIDKNQKATGDKQDTMNNDQETRDNKGEADVKSSVISDQSSSVDAEKKSSSVGKIVQKLVAWGFEKSSGRKIDTIIVHTSYNALGGDEFDKDKVIQEWKDAGVAPHYMIARDGTVYQLVADQNIAWHAGVAKTPDGRTDVNAFSIGVEVINTKEEKFSSAQYEALNRLIGDLKQKYSIKYILGHSEIAPERKTDPWGITWSKVSR